MNPSQVRAMLAALKARYPLFPLQEPTIRAYSEDLSDMTPSDLEMLSAVRAWARAHDRFPTIADLRAAIGKQIQDRPIRQLPAPKVSAEESARVLERIKKWRRKRAQGAQEPLG